MSWDCPYQVGIELHCRRRNKPCAPLNPGCILEGKVRWISDPIERPSPGTASAAPVSGDAGDGTAGGLANPAKKTDSLAR